MAPGEHNCRPEWTAQTMNDIRSGSLKRVRLLSRMPEEPAPDVQLYPSPNMRKRPQVTEPVPGPDPETAAHATAASSTHIWSNLGS